MNARVYNCRDIVSCLCVCVCVCVCVCMTICPAGPDGPDVCDERGRQAAAIETEITCVHAYDTTVHPRSHTPLDFEGREGAIRFIDDLQHVEMPLDEHDDESRVGHVLDFIYRRTHGERQREGGRERERERERGRERERDRYECWCGVGERVRMLARTLCLVRDAGRAEDALVLVHAQRYDAIDHRGRQLFRLQQQLRACGHVCVCGYTC